MPLYEYRCDACGHHFEVIQKFSDPPVDTCPVCGGAVQKELSSPAFQFKGTGWYVTDYARKDVAKTDKTSSGDEKAAGEKKSDKSEKAGSADSGGAAAKPTDAASKAS